MSNKNERPHWIGVDFDKTLATHETEWGIDRIGEPIPTMIHRVKKWLSEGKTVKIFTARASYPEQTPIIQDWLEKQGLPRLEVTNIKDGGMRELWDDRAVRVVRNTGAIDNDFPDVVATEKSKEYFYARMKKLLDEFKDNDTPFLFVINDLEKNWGTEGYYFGKQEDKPEKVMKNLSGLFMVLDQLIKKLSGGRFQIMVKPTQEDRDSRIIIP
jgi:hypothetical protein